MRRFLSFLCFSVTVTFIVYGLADIIAPDWQLPPLLEIPVGVAGGALIGKVVSYGWFHFFH